MPETFAERVDRAGEDVWGFLYNPRHGREEPCPMAEYGPGQCLVCWWRGLAAGTKPA